MKTTKSLKEFKEILYQKKIEASALPPHAVMKPKLSQKNTNELTKSVLAYLNYHPETFAYRVNNGAVYDAKRGTYRKGNTVKGIADITCCTRGKMIQIEIKFGPDKQSDAQRKFQEKIEKSGGQYWIVKTFDDIIEKFEAYQNN